MNKLIAACILPVLIATGAWAAPIAGTPQSEIIYRTHLGRADDVKLLIEQGVSANLTNDEGIPLLSLAASRKDKEGMEIMKVLLAAGADINAKDVEGQTALFHAARQGNKPAALYLLETGIQYYIVDNNGDIARNLAHREGHKELLAAMDDFVKNEGVKRKAEYEAYHSALQERQDAERKAIEAHQASQTKEEKEKFDEAVANNKELNEQYRTQLENLQQAQREERDALMAKREEEAFEHKLYDLAYNTCAFQYWSFCKEMNQTTEISKTEVSTAIDMHREAIIDLSRDLVEEYELTQPYLDGIINRSKKRIFVQLKRMPSKSYRFEHGVGKMEDFHTRCTEVAKRWNDKTPIAMGQSEGSSFSDQLDQQPRKKRRRR